MSNYGLLLAMMEPTAGNSAEFQDWYDNEHIPERANITGFLNAERLVCTDGWPRYLALYDIESADVLVGKEYSNIAFDNFSRWTKRMLPRVTGFYRRNLVQIAPGRAAFAAAGAVAQVELLRFGGLDCDVSETITSNLSKIEKIPGVRQVRLFETTDAGRRDHVLIIESAALGATVVSQIDARMFGPAGEKLDLVNLYRPYWRTAQ